MSLPTDSELREIVNRVVQRTLQGQGGLPPATTTMPAMTPAAPMPTTTAAVAQAKPILQVKNGIAIGADHGGYALKEMLESYLSEQGYNVVDCGTHNSEAVDYADYALEVAKKVANGQVWRGIMIDGAGIGSCMAANKVDGVRAAMCYDHATAHNSREHNDANLLTLGAGLIGPSLAKQIVDTFLKTDFGGGRHARRVEKIMAIETKT